MPGQAEIPKVFSQDPLAIGSKLASGKAQDVPVTNLVTLNPPFKVIALGHIVPRSIVPEALREGPESTNEARSISCVNVTFRVLEAPDPQGQED